MEFSAGDPFKIISSLNDSSSMPTRRNPISLITHDQQRQSIWRYSFLSAADFILSQRFGFVRFLCFELPGNWKTMNVSGDALIVVTVMLLMHCSIGMCLSKIDENYQQQQRVHDRTKRFVFLKSSGIGVSWIVWKWQSVISSVKNQKFFHFQYLVAIAIPTSAVNNQRVYMALNFEAHYGLADADTFLDKFNHKVCTSNPNIHCS